MDAPHRWTSLAPALLAHHSMLVLRALAAHKIAGGKHRQRTRLATWIRGRAARGMGDPECSHRPRRAQLPARARSRDLYHMRTAKLLAHLTPPCRRQSRHGHSHWWP